jgi:ribose transport system substrate-binding protein
MAVRSVTSLALILISVSVCAEEGTGLGLTTPVVLPAFNPAAPACRAPPGLGKSLMFAQDNRREFMQGVKQGLEAAAKDRSLAFQTAVADNDAAKMISQVQLALDSNLGAVVAAPVDALSLAPHLQKLIWRGVYVGTVVPPPAVSLLNAPQYLTGQKLGEAAATYIEDRLKGKAKVVLLTHDSLQFLAPRFVAMRDALNRLPGVEIVADISPPTVNKEGGSAMMQNILLAHPDIDVVLGADTVVLGALSAVRSAGKARPDQFFGGIDGEPEAIDEIKRGGPYKVTISLASPVFGYAMGQHAADWLEGKSIPQAIDILPSTIGKDSLESYESARSDPAKIYQDFTLRHRYLKMYGNICYDSRDQFINFAWSSEVK